MSYYFLYPKIQDASKGMKLEHSSVNGTVFYPDFNHIGLYMYELKGELIYIRFAKYKNFQVRIFSPKFEFVGENYELPTNQLALLLVQ